MAETVNHPAHYNAGKLEVIDAIEGLELGFHAGNVVKYVARYKHKGGVEDLRKARWYLERLNANEEAAAAQQTIGSVGTITIQNVEKAQEVVALAKSGSTN